MPAIGAAVAGGLAGGIASAGISAAIGGKGGGSLITETPLTTLASVKNVTSKRTPPVDPSKNPVKPAKMSTATGKIGVLDDPWQPTKEWYKDLGGEGEPNFDDVGL